MLLPLVAQHAVEHDVEQLLAFAHVLEGNAASCRVLDKLGMINEGIRRQHVRKGKKLLDVVLYGMLRDEWQQHRNG